MGNKKLTDIDLILNLTNIYCCYFTILTYKTLLKLYQILYPPLILRKLQNKVNVLKKLISNLL